MRKPKTFPGRGRSPQKKASRKVREVRKVFIVLTLAAEAYKSHFRRKKPPPRWFAGVFARYRNQAPLNDSDEAEPLSGSRT